jgi:hypothetical protein
MMNCVRIFFSWDIFKLHVVNTFKCVLAFGSDEGTEFSPNFNGPDDGRVG